MTDTRRVEIGRTYAVEIEGERFQVKVIRVCPEEPGWFYCKTADGAEIVLPPEALCEPAD